MTTSNRDQLTAAVQELRNFSSSMVGSIVVVRWIGYGMLLLTLFDLISIIYPASLMNATWELQTLGQIVERTPVPLLGLGLIFFGEANFRGAPERLLLKGLSWLCLLLGVLLLLAIPLGVSATLRLDAQNTNQISVQYKQQIAQVGQLEQQFRGAKPQDIESFYKKKGVVLDAKNPQEMKDKLLSGVNQREQSLQAGLEQSISDQRQILLKNSVKWNLGAFVSGFIFIYIWRLTRWARHSA